MAFSASTIWEINAASDDIFPYNIVDSTGTGTFTLIVEGSATPPIVYSSNYNTLTGDPFVNGTGGNFALNTLGSQYALLKGTAYNGNYNSTAGYEDIGAAQHLDSPATTIVIRNQLVR